VTRRDVLASLAAAFAPPHSTLVHEHVLVDFIGADQIRSGRYDPDAAFQLAKPKLDEIYQFGCRRLLECTPNFLGRDPKLLRRLSDATGIDIWTNTGLYAAGNYKYLPAFVRTEDAPRLAKRWIEEAERGVDGLRPRFIKIGVNRGPLGELDRKVLEAAALCSAATGLTIAAHTGDGPAALEELEIIAARVPAGRFVWVHAQNEIDPEVHARVAKAGAWVEFDGISEKSANWHRQCVEAMQRRGLLSQVLISQDAGWYHVGEPQGGNFRGYNFIYREFLPSLPADWHEPLLVRNPERAFRTRSR
jgi:phosphotriesterase-related protein